MKLRRISTHDMFRNHLDRPLKFMDITTKGRRLISYAQNFEDVMLARLFAGRKTGFYVDVGAADPINLSVTKWFYELGWSGINIEPNRQLFERLSADRPRDINLECGVGSAAQEALFFEPEVGELSSFDMRVQENAASDGRKGSTRSVSVVTLTSLLDQHCDGRTIDFLKIDVEGWEHEAIKGLDLAVYRPIVLVIEATLPESQIESHMDWEPLLLKGNYTFVYFDGVNRFYLANEHLALQQHFNRPPNVFDDFRSYALVTAEFDAKQRLENVMILQALHDDVKKNLDAASEKLNESNQALLQVTEEKKLLSIAYDELNAAYKELSAAHEGLNAAHNELSIRNGSIPRSPLRKFFTLLRKKH